MARTRNCGAARGVSHRTLRILDAATAGIDQTKGRRVSLATPPRDCGLPARGRLDHRAPAFLVPSLELEFDVDPVSTQVCATISFRRNPAASADPVAALVLDGEMQENVEAELDGRVLGSGDAIPGPGTLTIANPPERGTLSVRSRIAPERNAALASLKRAMRWDEERFGRAPRLSRDVGAIVARALES